MSVFTALDASRIADFLATFDLGELRDWQGIEGGSENSNFFVDSSSGRHVLTLIERGDPAHLAFMIRLLDCLHAAGLPVPFALRNRQGQALCTLADRPALLQPRLRGSHPGMVDSGHCRSVGAMLCRLHHAAASLTDALANPRGLDWIISEAQQLCDGPWSQEHAVSSLITVLCTERHAIRALPCTVIHADLFRDNVLFHNRRISGVIDFHNAGRDSRLYELAICVNDWCFAEQEPPVAPVLQAPLVDALLDAYAIAAPTFTAEEQRLWPLILQLAALRFWVSRHHYRDLHAGQHGVLLKDPARMQHILQWHLQQPPPPLPDGSDA